MREQSDAAAGLDHTEPQMITLLCTSASVEQVCACRSGQSGLFIYLFIYLFIS